jgi:hypothetical protein
MTTREGKRNGKNKQMQRQEQSKCNGKNKANPPALREDDKFGG